MISSPSFSVAPNVHFCLTLVTPPGIIQGQSTQSPRPDKEEGQVAQGSVLSGPVEVPVTILFRLWLLLPEQHGVSVCTATPTHSSNGGS